MFYEIFKKLCLDNGISEMQVAQDCGISKAAIATWRKGTQPYNKTIKKLADYFNVSPSYLMGIESKPHPQVYTEFSKEEEIIIQRYRQEVDMQKAVKKLLDIE